ncbi:SDR family NAD(P)-dependent oxidoreductase [Oscillospiraceae bacterium CM]|nr:SDR family NAD(P)-dependent oxidoreductase [Oscillospiraceae bacterium CM]
MKTVVVTGATSGIGFAVCAALLQDNCRVIALGRSAETCRASEEALRALVPGARVTFYAGDLLHLSDIRALAQKIRADLQENSAGRLDALINNAGCVRRFFMTTPEGYEHQFALNHLAGYLLTHELLANLLEAQGRVIITSSASHRLMRMRWKDLMFEKRYSPLLAYKQSKLCNMLFARGLMERYADMGLRAYGVDPGLVKTDIGNKNTGGLVGFVWTHRKKTGVDPSVPASIYKRLMTEKPAPAGLCHGLNGPARISREVNRQNTEQLFAVSDRLLGIRFGVTAS